MATYIDPITDVGFKLLFGREKVSEPLLVDFLNALLCNQEDYGKITSVRYLNNERTSEWMDGKGIRYDILCETDSGQRFIVEMQKASQPNFIDRSNFYVSRSIAEQGFRGKGEEEVDWDYDLKPVFGIFICNFHVPTLERRPVVRASVLDEESLKPIGMKTRYIFIQLPFFRKREDECSNQDDQWIYNIKNMGLRQEVAFKSKSEVFRRLAEVANVATLSPAERRSYEADIKNARDTLNQIRGAYKDGVEEGRTQGLEEGRTQGLEEGRTQGLEEGRTQGLEEGRMEERRKNIMMMLSFGVPVDAIAAKFGMTNEEITRLID